MRQRVRRLLQRVAPTWTIGLLARRARAHSHRVVQEWGCGVLNQTLIKHLGPAVQEGPFAGAILGRMATAEHLGPYLLGVYESELDRAWDVVFRGSYPQIVDIGAKFGYYAVGFALRYPAAAVVAFDADSWARRATREMAAANRVTNITVLGVCGPDWLMSDLRDGAFVISDCEGYEAELFSAEVLPYLRTVTLIIETHDEAVPGVTDRLRLAFAQTHTVDVIADGIGRRFSTRTLDFLSDHDVQFANKEIRPPSQKWLLCVPKLTS